MAKNEETAEESSGSDTPEVPWADAGREVVEPGIGEGFVEWGKHGDALRGILLHKWQSRSMKAPAVTIELTEKPKVRIVNTQGGGRAKTVKCKKGDLVNVSLSYDLTRKLTPDLEGCEVGLWYLKDQETPKGSMRVFRVFHFESPELPF